MPTFVFFKNKEVVDRIQGSHPMLLEGKIKSHVNVRDENDEVKSVSSYGEVSEVSSTASVKARKEERTSVMSIPAEAQENTQDENSPVSSAETQGCCFKFNKKRGH